MNSFLFLLEPLLILALLVGAAAGLIWLERRLLGLWQDRYGPNRVGPFGILQVLADMIKILTKEDWVPPFADKLGFMLAPVIALSTLLLAYAVVPMSPDIGVVNMPLGLLFFLAMASLAVYAVILGGWSSNNKYALLGAMRSAAQTISYEVFMGLALMGVVVQAGSFDLREIVKAQEGLWYVVPQFLGFVIFLIAGVAATHRLPFDMPEAEHELTAGYHTEYSGMKFGMFFVGEYVGVILISALVVTLFFGGWLGPGLPPLLWFLIKTFAFIVFFILLRASLPRPRYDQLMAVGWKVLLPLSLLNVVVTGGIVLGSAHAHSVDDVVRTGSPDKAHGAALSHSKGKASNAVWWAWTDNPEGRDCQASLFCFSSRSGSDQATYIALTIETLQSSATLLNGRDQTLVELS